MPKNQHNDAGFFIPMRSQTLQKPYLKSVVLLQK
jgi:hypothetical protein